MTDPASTPGLREGNVLTKVEAIRLKARNDILALGFKDSQLSVDVGIFGAEEIGIFHLAQELGWTAAKSWYEPPVKTDGGEITIYLEQVWW